MTDVPPSRFIIWWVVFALVVVAVLGGLDYAEHQYFPWGRLRTSPALVTVCGWIGTVLAAFFVSRTLETQELKWSLIGWLVGGVASAIPLAYLLLHSGYDFYQYPTSQGFRISESGIPAPRPLFVLLSDTHVTASSQTLEGFCPDDHRLKQLLDRISLLNPALIVISGDLTDSGTEAEWKLFDQATAPTGKHAGVHLILAPGNHDLQGSPFELPGRENISEERARLFSYLERQHRFFREMDLMRPMASTSLSDSTQYETAWTRARDQANSARIDVRVGHSGTEGPSITSYDVGTEGLDEGFLQAMGAYNAFFPTLLFLSPEVAVLVLNSNSRARPGGSMGLGDLGDDQLSRLETVLGQLASNRSLHEVLIVLHHPPARHATDAWSLRAVLRKGSNSDVYEHTWLALSLTDAKKLIDVVNRFAEARQDINVALLYGHRHQKYLGKTSSGVWLVEAPAVVEYDDGFWAGYADEGHLKIEWVPSGAITVAGICRGGFRRCTCP